MTRENTKIVIIGLIAATALTLILWMSLATTEYKLKVKNVHTKYVTYATAEFSETSSGFDYDGEYYSDIDHWSEPASTRIVWVTRNGIPSNVMTADPNLFTDIPRHDPDFDGIQWHRSVYYWVVADKEGKPEEFTLTEKEYRKVLNRNSDYIKADINGWGMVRRIK